MPEAPAELVRLSQTEKRRIRMRVWSMLDDLGAEMGDEERIAEAKALSAIVAANLGPTIEQILGERLATHSRREVECERLWDMEERLKLLIEERDRHTTEANNTPDPLTGRHSTMRAFVLIDDLRAVMSGSAS